MGEDLGRAVSDPDLDSPGLKEEGLRELYRMMALTRRADLEATALQRQGELAVYPPLAGQEAAQVGSAYALEESDWIFPSYRELGAAVVRGVDLVEYLHFYRATWHGGTYDATAHRFGYVSVPVASQILHAVPTGGNDVALEAIFGLSGVTLGAAAGLGEPPPHANRIRHAQRPVVLAISSVYSG